MPELEERQARMEGILEQMDKRISSLEERLEAGLNSLRAEMGSLRTEMHSNFRWMVGIMVTAWVTLMVAILFKG